MFEIVVQLNNIFYLPHANALDVINIDDDKQFLLVCKKELPGFKLEESVVCSILAKNKFLKLIQNNLLKFDSCSLQQIASIFVYIYIYLEEYYRYYNYISGCIGHISILRYFKH